METTPFKVSKVDSLPILTLVVDSINARNAHWIKDEILHYLQKEQPKGLLVNLNNIMHIGHIGLGALIAINNQLRNLKPHAFVGLQSEVREKIQASHLDKVFQIWSPGEACIICHELNCVHRQGFIDKIREFPAVKIDESAIPHLGQPVVHTEPAGPLDLDDEHPVAPRGGNRAGFIVSAVILIAATGVATWFAAQSYFNRAPNVPLSQDEVLERFDKNRDGRLDPADAALMDPTERMTMSFSPYCKQLGMKCSSWQK